MGYIQPCAYYLLLPDPQFVSCQYITDKIFLKFPPRQVLKKKNGSRSLLFLAFKGFLLRRWDLILFAIRSSPEEVRKNRKAQDRYSPVFNGDRQRWESTDQLFPLGRARAIRRRKFSV